MSHKYIQWQETSRSFPSTRKPKTSHLQVDPDSISDPSSPLPQPDSDVKLIFQTSDSVKILSVSIWYYVEEATLYLFQTKDQFYFHRPSTGSIPEEVKWTFSRFNQKK